MPIDENNALMSTTFRFMETFAQRNGNSARLEHNHGAAYLCIERPSTLAAFLAFCNGQSTNTRTYLRGCTVNYSTAYPSLFRENSDVAPQCEQRRRWHAYKHALAGIRRLNGRRWRRKNLGAILQHYGVRTPWLDVVRNLYTAIWFATHDLTGSGLHGVARPTRTDHYWISFYRRQARTAEERLTVKDLSAHHSSLHARPHAQHGLSLSMQPDGNKLPSPCQDFNRFRIAQVRIPNGEKWKLSGHMFSSAFLFPSAEFDDSLRLLSTAAVQGLLEDSCARFKLPPGTLGKISCYR